MMIGSFNAGVTACVSLVGCDSRTARGSPSYGPSAISQNHQRGGHHSRFSKKLDCRGGESAGRESVNSQNQWSANQVRHAVEPANRPLQKRLNLLPKPGKASFRRVHPLAVQAPVAIDPMMFMTFSTQHERSVAWHSGSAIPLSRPNASHVRPAPRIAVRFIAADRWETNSLKALSAATVRKLNAPADLYTSWCWTSEKGGLAVSRRHLVWG
jgi:hypothetical protein